MLNAAPHKWVFEIRFVTPAEAGVQKLSSRNLDSGLRRNDMRGCPSLFQTLYYVSVYEICSQHGTKPRPLLNDSVGGTA